MFWRGLRSLPFTSFPHRRRLFSSQLKKQSFFPLYDAANDGDAEKVSDILKSSLLDCTNRKTEKGQTPLVISCIKGHSDVVQILLQNKADPNKEGKLEETPLFVSAEGGFLDIVQHLIDAKANPNKVVDSFGMTPLGIASGKGKTEVVQLLLESKALADYAPNGIKSPFFNALDNGHLHITDLLIEHHCDVNKEHDNGRTALQAASSATGVDRNQLVEYLINKKASVNAVNKDGTTAIEYASVLNDGHITKLLLDNKADMTQKSVQLACYVGAEKVVQLFMERGASDFQSYLDATNQGLKEAIITPEKANLIEGIIKKFESNNT